MPLPPLLPGNAETGCEIQTEDRKCADLARFSSFFCPLDHVPRDSKAGSGHGRRVEPVRRPEQIREQRQEWDAIGRYIG